MPAQSLMAELRERARNLGAGEIAALPIRTFARWVDEGAEQARLVGETGHVMGIDLDQKNIQAASKIGLSFPNISLRRAPFYM